MRGRLPERVGFLRDWTSDSPVKMARPEGSAATYCPGTCRRQPEGPTGRLATGLSSFLSGTYSTRETAPESDPMSKRSLGQPTGRKVTIERMVEKVGWVTRATRWPSFDSRQISRVPAPRTSAASSMPSLEKEPWMGVWGGERGGEVKKMVGIRGEVCEALVSALTDNSSLYVGGPLQRAQPKVHDSVPG